MKISTIGVSNLITCLLICFIVFMTNINNSVVYISYILVTSLLLIISLFNKKIPKKHFILFLFIVVFMHISFFIGNDGITNMAINFALLLIFYVKFCMLEEKQLENNNIFNKMLYMIGIFSIIFHLLYNYRINVGDSSDFFFISSSDKNFACVYIFLFYCFCMKRKKYLGVLLSVTLAMFFYSRLFIVSVIVNLILIYVSKVSNKHLNGIQTFFKSFSSKDIYILILIMTISIVGLSYYMAYCIPINSITGYRESLNDSSNAIRVRANVYAINEVKTDWKFIFSGYDNSIKKNLGVVDRYNSTYFMGFRLVQPHNFLLNFVLRYGIIMTLIYLSVLCRVLSKFWNKNNNYVYIIPYLIMNMVMHSLFSNILLIFFIWVLNTNEGD